MNPIPDAQPSAPSPPTETALFEVFCSRHFTGWLADERLSLAFTTYQAGKLFLIGLNPAARLSIFNRTLSRCMGLWGDGQTLYLSTLFQLWRFENSLGPGETYQGYDRLYVPQLGWTTGDLDIHDIAVDGQGGPIFVNTLFSCLATVSERHSFLPLWQPPFITKLAAEDRCHLNGVALDRGVPRYVTAVGRSDVADGWREHRAGGGLLIDVERNAVVLDGLSMPHSPRLYRDKLWLLDSGRGQFGYVDVERGVFEPVAFCPGYARGLAFRGDYAIVGISRARENRTFVGISRARENRTFSGFALDEALLAKGAEARTGILVIDLRTGDVLHWLRITGVIAELYDVVALLGVVRPMALGFRTEEVQRMITVGPYGDG
jgi:uncharacterized protein (TIGR03032 family)